MAIMWWVGYGVAKVCSWMMKDLSCSKYIHHSAMVIHSCWTNVHMELANPFPLINRVNALYLLLIIFKKWGSIGRVGMWLGPMIWYSHSSTNHAISSTDNNPFVPQEDLSPIITFLPLPLGPSCLNFLPQHNSQTLPSLTTQSLFRLLLTYHPLYLHINTFGLFCNYVCVGPDRVLTVTLVGVTWLCVLSLLLPLLNASMLREEVLEKRVQVGQAKSFCFFGS